MSRGSFDYLEFRMNELSDLIEDLIEEGRFEEVPLIGFQARVIVDQLGKVRRKIETLDAYVSGDIGAQETLTRIKNED
jgi:hypothetical protein